MPGKKTTDFGHVASASVIGKDVMAAIMRSITGQTSVQGSVSFGVDDYALKVFRFVRDQCLTNDGLGQLMASKSKRDRDLLASELPFLVNTMPEVFFTTSQKTVKDKINNGEPLSDEDYAKFKGQNLAKLKRYITLLEEGSAMPGSVMQQVLTAATTEATRKTDERLDPEIWMKGKLIKALTSPSTSRSEKDWIEGITRDAMASSLEEFPLAREY